MQWPAAPMAYSPIQPKSKIFNLRIDGTLTIMLVMKNSKTLDFCLYKAYKNFLCFCSQNLHALEGSGGKKGNITIKFDTFPET
jgi:hypothetical protein